MADKASNETKGAVLGLRAQPAKLRRQMLTARFAEVEAALRSG
jgi:hypothetical protein